MEKVFNIDGKEFYARFDEQALIEQIQEFEPFEEGMYTGFAVHWDEPKITEEEFNKNVEDFVNEVRRACKDVEIENVIRKIPKKKNGMFCKNRKEPIAYYGNTNFFQEWHNTWRTYELRYSAIDEKTLELQIVTYNYTPCQEERIS